MKKIKKILVRTLVFAVAVASTLCLSTGGYREIARADEAIQLNRTTLNLSKGKSRPLELKNVAEGVKWTTSDDKIAKVDAEGKVTARHIGKATITAEYDGKSYECKVFVTDKKLKVNKNKITMKKGQIKKLKVTLKHSANVYYITENSNIVKCSWTKKWKKHSTTLKIKANAPGTTKVLIYSKGRYIAVNVNVKE